MKVIIVEPGKHPVRAEIENTLEAMQKTVGGYIESIYPWKDPVALVCDDEGVLKQYPFNRMVSPGNAIFGTFFLCGLGEENFTDFPDELVEKYMQKLFAPELLVSTPRGYIGVPVSEKQWEAMKRED